MGTWLGERLFAANSGELAQIRSNLRELRPHSPTFFSRELRECSVNLPNFTRIRTEFAVNWQTVRQKNVIVSSYFPIFDEQSFAANHRSVKKFAANCFLGERLFANWRTCSRRTPDERVRQRSQKTLFAAGGQKFATGGYCSRRTSANNVRCHQYPPAANSCLSSNRYLNDNTLTLT